ncbi:MAG TPA: DUF4397 domain-containing protein, partial [Luteitalea sp.]|nr:DUF4397 domain-containing protein [Luteitalea sp.]
MRTILLATIATAALSATSAFAQPAPPASVVIVHGLPGGDLQQPAELPVDISVDGSCALTRVAYRSIIGPLSLPPGTRRIAVHYPATGTCASAAAIGPAAVPFFSGENATVIAHVGPDGRPTASKFVNNVSAMPAGRARAAIHHTANAPQVDVYLTRAFGSPLQTTALTTGLTPGEQTVTPVAGDAQQFAITAAGASAAAFGPVGLNLSANYIFSFYVVGSLTNGTL